MGEIAQWQAGSTPKRSNPELYGGDIAWLKTGDLTDGLVDTTDETITPLALTGSLKINSVGSLVMAMYGATIGKLGILEIPAATNQAAIAANIHGDIQRDYLFFWLMSARKAFIDSGAGGAQPNISKEKIINSLFPLPPKNEQIKIINSIKKIL